MDKKVICTIVFGISVVFGISLFALGVQRINSETLQVIFILFGIPIFAAISMYGANVINKIDKKPRDAIQRQGVKDE